jgi:hypothetical protein
MMRMVACRMPVKYSVQRQPREGLATNAAETIGPDGVSQINQNKCNNVQTTHLNTARQQPP